MGGIPFTVYDFFGYLSSGAVLVALGDFGLGYHEVFKEKLPPAMWALLIMLAYVTGHAVAHLSSLMIENFFVVRVLGRPADVLLAKGARIGVARRLFSGYFRPLPEETRQRIHAQASARGFVGTGESLFLHALPLVAKEEKNQKRLDEFRNLYGFARNMAFTLALSGVGLFVIAIRSKNSSLSPLAICSVLLSIVMLYRYLKFYRQYCYQLLIVYAELIDLKPDAAISAAV